MQAEDSCLETKLEHFVLYGIKRPP